MGSKTKKAKLKFTKRVIVYLSFFTAPVRQNNKTKELQHIRPKVESTFQTFGPFCSNVAELC
jgi:hypothetical protein